jgi:hypothetical protein
MSVMKFSAVRLELSQMYRKIPQLRADEISLLFQPFEKLLRSISLLHLLNCALREG